MRYPRSLAAGGGSALPSFNAWRHSRPPTEAASRLLRSGSSQVTVWTRTVAGLPMRTSRRGTILHGRAGGDFISAGAIGAGALYRRHARSPRGARLALPAGRSGGAAPRAAGAAELVHPEPPGRERGGGDGGRRAPAHRARGGAH